MPDSHAAATSGLGGAMTGVTVWVPVAAAVASLDIGGQIRLG
ncbi:hypothetical protein [Rhodococcus sp. 27YEA15]